MESEHGISYTEFSYMLLQANDFRYLCEHYDVELQMGGSDQWGNITTGIDLIRRTLGRTAHGLTWPLLTLPGGAKMGKTAGGAVWLDPDKTSPYQFRQFWVQAADAEVDGYLRRLSLRSLDEVEDLISAHEVAPEQRRAQRALAGELTELVHGPEAAAAAEEAAGVLFGGDPMAASAGAFAVVRREVGCTAVAETDLDDPVAPPRPDRAGGLQRGRPADHGPARLPGQRAGAGRRRGLAAGPPPHRRALPSPAPGQDHLPRGRTCPRRLTPHVSPGRVFIRP